MTTRQLLDVFTEARDRFPGLVLSSQGRIALGQCLPHVGASGIGGDHTLQHGNGFGIVSVLRRLHAQPVIGLGMGRIEDEHLAVMNRGLGAIALAAIVGRELFLVFDLARARLRQLFQITDGTALIAGLAFEGDQIREQGILFAFDVLAFQGGQGFLVFTQAHEGFAP